MARARNRWRPIDRVPTASLIADQLREAIMSGDLVQGAQVGEAQLAERLGVSRGPLREAMQRLVQEGLLLSIPHRGLFVVELSEQDVRDIYTARTAVETAAVLVILADDEADKIALRLEKAVTRMETAAARGDAQTLSQSDLAFHELLVAESGSARLQRMTSTLLVETRMCIAALMDKYVAPTDLAAEHAEIVDAIRSGDRDRAVRVVTEHMEDAVDRLARGVAEASPA